jgi:hypothetical protein
MGLPGAQVGVDTGSGPARPTGHQETTRKATNNLSENHHNVPCRHEAMTWQIRFVMINIPPQVTRRRTDVPALAPVPER